MTRFTHFRFFAALSVAVTTLTLAIALAPGAASAQEADTLTISGTFTVEWLDGIVGPDLAEVYANGHEHTWTLTLHGTTQTHHRLDPLTYRTTIHATSFDLEFFGPDAATLNGIVSEHITGGDVMIRLWNNYGVGFALWEVSVFGPDVEFWTGE